jgi:hypothetical protein
MKRIETTPAFFVLFLIASSRSAGVLAADITIDFESVPGVSTTGFFAGSSVPVGARLSNQLLSSHGVLFASENQPYAALIALGVGHATSGANGMSAVTSANTVSYADDVIVRFFDPMNTAVPAVSNEVSFRIDLADTSSNPVRLEAYSLGGALLALDERIDASGETLLVTTANIHRVHLIGSGSSAFDDFSFNELVPVPEPSTAIFFAIALLTVTARIRKQRTGAVL